MNIQLNPVEIAQLIYLIENRQQEGSYYGNKEHYEKREQKILEKFMKALAETELEIPND